MAASAPSDIYQKAVETTGYLRSLLPKALQAPALAVICGSGLGGLEHSINSDLRVEAAYVDVPNFAVSTVHGHAGKLVFGSLSELTNAAGGLNPDYAVGDVMVLNDHLNLAGLAGIHSLRGPNADEFGSRFTALSDAYDLELRRLAHAAWDSLQLPAGKRRIHEGVYAFVSGPTYETRAECRMLRGFGADVVGMSTVPEIVVARHCGLNVFALSLVTNNAVLEPGPRGNDSLVGGSSGQELARVMESGKASHEEVLHAGQDAAKDVQALIVEMVRRLRLSQTSK
ncbi:MAG: hypothetical protein M1838_003650 [Thelocarpon superellum]|nr:MAG: hypothetical protein M1838_003650 [Thelocarpon superellum]